MTTMSTTEIIHQLSRLREALDQLAARYSLQLAPSTDRDIKGEPPPDDDWSPNGLVAVHVEYLAASLHRLADDLTAVVAADSSTSDDSEQQHTDEWDAGNRVMAHLDYLVEILGHVTHTLHGESEGS